MIRHTLASAALVATALLATEAYGAYAEERRAPEARTPSRALAGYAEIPFVPVPPEPATGSAQRPPSNLTRGTEIPLVPAPRDPGQARSASPVPAGATRLFSEDFENGGFARWDSCQNVFVNSDCDTSGVGHALDLVGQARKGEFAARFVVKPGDVPDFGGGERSEVASHSDEMATRSGDRRWYEFSLFFPEDFPNPVEGDWFIVMQWHAGDGSPPLAVEVSPDGELYLGGDGVEHDSRRIGPVRRGEWVDYVMHVGFSRSASEGFVEVWENGEQVVERVSRATMSSDENYFKMGIYRGNGDDSTAAVLIDDLAVYAG
ncbi:MAG TPA: polysaccharide lyase [Pseudonocardia sp.]|nr:polysaccharide lyase [Pseudonocardia sp.]